VRVNDRLLEAGVGNFLSPSGKAKGERGEENVRGSFHGIGEGLFVKRGISLPIMLGLSAQGCKDGRRLHGSGDEELDDR
jgi:hypothetical protein